MIETNYININKDCWNKSTPHHIKSDFYDQQNFLNGKSSLNDIELSLLGNLKGKKVLHLQCHFGQDTISLARLGADVTGIDFSEVAIENANFFAKQTNTNCTFICCDLYELNKHLNEKFDLVFTSYGTIGWLPDLTKWATIVSSFVKPNGKFIMVDFHPVMWMFDNDFNKITYNYFNSEPIIESSTSTYADKDTQFEHQTITWNHSMSEIISSLLIKKLNLTHFNEYDYSPYNCFNNSIKIEDKKYRIQDFENKIPLVYSLVFQANTNI